MERADGRSARVMAVVPVLVSAAVTGLLLVISGRYGYHRDEFYYLAAGLHPALGYVDQPPLTPMIARAEVALFGYSPTALRIAPAIAAGATVYLTAAITRELGAGTAARALAACCAAVSAFALATGHVLATSTFDLLAWTALTVLLIRALRHGGRSWLAVGLVTGVALENKSLVLAFLGAVVIGVLAVGPRTVFRDRWLWVGVAVAVVLWAPHLAWQIANGWPQLAMARQIATVGNGGSAPAWSFPLFQLLEVSPLLVPIWVAGLVALIRDPRLRSVRAFAVAYGVLFVILLVGGGKHYYLAGMYPILLAAGAAPTVRWMLRSRPRRLLVGLGIGASAVIVPVLMLPLLPVRTVPDNPVGDIQPITAETVGWPELADAVAVAYRTVPPERRPQTVALTGNYGEAGAVDLFRRRMDLPPAYSGHNSYAQWGPPPDSVDTVVAIGIEHQRLRRWFGSVRRVTRVDNRLGIDNDEQGAVVWVCTGRRLPWQVIWPEISHLG
ncbi:ArnT family glycosyltransferase [Microlunatus soli]|uniref:4-amino-4-deoxy-L-arabinose transferase n=1 Tax=Microlunatus soli TaxID=630515 RepID=A0A1H1RAY7_9ACTN|nr:glycosyltransferase family 39 protein [Microlunatus soli]SDS32868.1 4-amino-4-deoxy-L-arabinose transferase [Microlunatus soli]